MAVLAAGLTAGAAHAAGKILTVDDFDGYADEAPNRIFDAWLDGWQNAANGSVVGNPVAPFAEQVIVRGGQSLNLEYDNTTAMVSEAERTLAQPLDLTDGGVMEALSLWYKGRPTPVGGLIYDVAAMTYTVTGSGTGIAGFADAFHYAYKNGSGDVSVVARIDSITNTHKDAMAGVMIRDSLEADAAHALAAVTPTNRVVFAFRASGGGSSGVTATSKDTITLPHYVRLTRQGTVIKAEHSSDGTTWQPVESGDPEDPSQFQILMDNDPLVGLAVSANSDENAVCEGVFSNVSITGAASGPLTESVDVGIVTNSPEKMYVALTDGAGATALAYNDAGERATGAADWTQWAIPLDAFAGIDLTSVSTILLGVGDKDNPQAGGAGMLYFDDIEAIRRMPVPGSVLLLAEDFDGLTLGPNVDEGVAGDAVWTKTAPTGWMIDDTGVPGVGTDLDGVTEWAGWSFADKDWWVETAGDQERAQFALGLNTVAIADGDEWDDADHAPGLLNSFLSTPEIDVLPIESGPGSIVLQFDSSWRREDTQTAVIHVAFDDGDPVEVLRYESEGADTGFVKDDATSELVTVEIARPAGAKKMAITFGIVEAGNDWWWAVDNIEVRGFLRQRAVILSEDFEGVPLGPNVEEGGAGTVQEAWTDTPPAGWFIDESGVPGVGDPAVDGVTEWAGWAIADKQFWIDTDGQRRAEFTLAEGAVLVADNDEWDDSTHPEGYDPAIDAYDTYVSTPAIDLSQVEAGTVQLKFDSSWRPEFDDN
jgi:hypothetical protein